jgi:hypothetical protein
MPDTTSSVIIAEIASDGDHYVLFPIPERSDQSTLFFRVPRTAVEIGGRVLDASNQVFEIKILENASVVRVVKSTVAEMVPLIQREAPAGDDPIALTSSRVTKAKELLASARTYTKGCSEFVCEVLGITWEEANALMGDAPAYIGDNNSYPGLVPGDIVGWKVGGGEGHVSVYVGETGVKFIDVRNSGAQPRKVVNGYGNGRSVFKSSRY